MLTAYTSDEIRAAERELMARLPEGTLMRRAATALAVACVNVMPRVYGSHVVLLVGSGDNGGDALYAGAGLARRGARVHAVLAGRKTHEGGLAELLRAGGVNVQETENVIFEGGEAAVARINLDSVPAAAILDAIRTGNRDILALDLLRV